MRPPLLGWVLVAAAFVWTANAGVHSWEQNRATQAHPRPRCNTWDICGGCLFESLDRVGRGRCRAHETKQPGIRSCQGSSRLPEFRARYALRTSSFGAATTPCGVAAVPSGTHRILPV